MDTDQPQEPTTSGPTDINIPGISTIEKDVKKVIDDLERVTKEVSDLKGFVQAQFLTLPNELQAFGLRELEDLAFRDIFKASGQINDAIRATVAGSSLAVREVEKFNKGEFISNFKTFWSDSQKVATELNRVFTVSVSPKTGLVGAVVDDLLEELPSIVLFPISEAFSLAPQWSSMPGDLATQMAELPSNLVGQIQTPGPVAENTTEADAGVIEALIGSSFAAGVLQVIAQAVNDFMPDSETAGLDAGGEGGTTSFSSVLKALPAVLAAFFGLVKDTLAFAATIQALKQGGGN